MMLRLVGMPMAAFLTLALTWPSASGSSERPLTQIAIPDPQRHGRVVLAKLCLPEGSASSLPLLVYGHGFDCNPQDYDYYCEFAATAMVYHNSRIYLDEDTKNLAADAAFLAAELPRQAKENTSSPLFGRLGTTNILGGHSMGGGTSILAAATHSPATGMFLTAPGLYTLPYAKPFLKNVTIPSVIVSGSNDCGPNALPKEAQPTYDGLASQRKVLIVLKGANHCGWTRPTEWFGVCAVPECHHLDRDTQHHWGVVLASTFSDALAGGAPGWEGFESFLAAGEANGTWTYMSSVTSPQSKALHNDCPCKGGIVV